MTTGNFILDAAEIHPSWREVLFDPDLVFTLDRISGAIDGDDYYPATPYILRFAKNDLSKVKHVIVGMDPYPSLDAATDRPQATGRSFEVSELAGKGWDYKIRQSSLRNILKAVYFNETGRNDDISSVRAAIADGSFDIVFPTRWFDAMERQGVLFLNSTLTVRAGEPGSHVALWGPFRELFVPALCSRGISWHLWGKDAQREYGSLLLEGESVLTAPHPRMSQFVMGNTFKLVDDVDWTGCRL